MLTLLLSAQDGGTAWRHLLAEGEARAGFEPVGPLHLVRRVGRLLGVPAEPATGPERLAAWALRLDRHDDRARAYSASRAQDPFGVARHLLSLRDQLRLAGWDGRALDGSGRLRDLAGLEATGSPRLSFQGTTTALVVRGEVRLPVLLVHGHDARPRAGCGAIQRRRIGGRQRGVRGLAVRAPGPHFVVESSPILQSEGMPPWALGRTSSSGWTRSAT